MHIILIAVFDYLDYAREIAADEEWQRNMEAERIREEEEEHARHARMRILRGAILEVIARGDREREARERERLERSWQKIMVLNMKMILIQIQIQIETIRQ